MLFVRIHPPQKPELQVKHLPISVFVAGTLLCAAHLSAHAFDSASIEAGTGNKTSFVRGSLQWNFRQALHESERMAIKGYWDLSLAQWRGTRFDNQRGAHQNLTNIGITPMFRFQQPGSRFYGEAGIGLHALSALYNNDGHKFSTAVQFGTQIGIGYRLSPRTDLGLSIQHYSNGGIKHPNSGVNFVSMKASYHFP